jgi:predicted amidohydrolase YtcJ
VLPGLVDGHMHLDKTLTGLPWMGHAAGSTRMSRIERIRRSCHTCRCRPKHAPAI